MATNEDSPMSVERIEHHFSLTLKQKVKLLTTISPTKTIPAFAYYKRMRRILSEESFVIVKALSEHGYLTAVEEDKLIQEAYESVSKSRKNETPDVFRRFVAETIGYKTIHMNKPLSNTQEGVYNISKIGATGHVDKFFPPAEIGE